MADAGVVFTECRRQMNDTCTVRRRYVIVARYEECFFAVQFADSIRIQRFIFFIFKRPARHFFHNGVIFAENFVAEFFRHVIGVIALLYFYVSDFRIYAQTEVGRKRPRRRRPCEEVCVFAFYFKADECGFFLYVFITLCHFVRRQRRSAARAIRHNFMAFVEQSFIPDFLERPPYGFDIIIMIRYVRVFHVRPVTYGFGKFFPHAFVFPDAFLTFFHERFNAVSFNLFLAVDAE